jgi:hypothetical protein
VHSLITVRESDAEVSPEDSRPLVDVLGLLEVVVGLREVLLLQRNISQTPPGVIMRLVSLERSLVALLSAVVVFICDELMAT